MLRMHTRKEYSIVPATLGTDYYCRAPSINEELVHVTVDVRRLPSSAGAPSA